MKLKLFAATTTFLALVTSACGGMVTFKWEYPQVEEIFIDGYRIYYSDTSFATAQKRSEVPGLLMSIEVPNRQARSFAAPIPPGMQYFRMTAYGTLESNFSHEVAADIPMSTPDAFTIDMKREVPR